MAGIWRSVLYLQASTGGAQLWGGEEEPRGGGWSTAANGVNVPELPTTSAKSYLTNNDALSRHIPRLTLFFKCKMTIDTHT